MRIPKKTNILDTVRKTIKEYNLLEKNENVLVAYSGGVDSTCLLTILLELRKEWNFRLFLGHFNHRLRKNAEKDEKFVRITAEEQSLPLFVGSEDVRSYAKINKLNIEEAGRILRYDFLMKTARRIGAKVATGHTMNDQAETFLIKLMRGSGLKGLAGIYPIKEGIVIRPLIWVERKDIESYIYEKGMAFQTDESNFDCRFLRNRIRLELIPYICEHFSPDIVPVLGRVSSILREEEVFLEKIVREKAQNVFIKKNGKVLLDCNLLKTLPLAVTRRVSRDFLKAIKGDLRSVSFKDVESVLALGEGKEISLKKNIILRREQDKIFLKEEKSQVKDYEYVWEGRKVFTIKEISLRFMAKSIEKNNVRYFSFNDEKKAYLDKDKLNFPLVVRNRKNGDVYQPIGAPGRKKLKEIMRAKRIPLHERKTLPVFLSSGEIVWIPGLPVSEKYKIDDSTSAIFIIERL